MWKKMDIREVDSTFLLLGDIGESVLVKLLLPQICQAVTPLQLLHQATTSLNRVQVVKRSVQTCLSLP